MQVAPYALHLAVQSALRNPGQPLPPFPQVREAAQRHDGWDEHYVPPTRASRPRGQGVTPTARPRQRVRAGFDIGNDRGEEEEPLSQENSPTASPERTRTPRDTHHTTSLSAQGNTVHEQPRRGSESIGPSRRRPSSVQRASFDTASSETMTADSAQSYAKRQA